MNVLKKQKSNIRVYNLLLQRSLKGAVIELTFPGENGAGNHHKQVYTAGKRDGNPSIEDLVAEAVPDLRICKMMIHYIIKIRCSIFISAKMIGFTNPMEIGIANTASIESGQSVAQTYDASTKTKGVT